MTNTANPINKTDVVNAINAEMTEKNMSQQQLAVAISQSGKGNISHAIISNMINGKHTQISEEMWRKVSDYLGLKTNTEADWNIQPLSNIQKVYGLCEAAMKEKSMKAIAAKTGLGKTVGLKVFAKKNPTTSKYVLLRKSMNVKDCLKTIASALNLDVDGKVSDMISMISNNLNKKGTTLILDDVGKVIDKFYPVLQELFDSTEGNCGIVLAGTDHFHTWMKRAKQKSLSSVPELFRRIGYWQNLNAPSANEVATIAKENGLTNQLAIQYITSRVENFGELRNFIVAIKRLQPSQINIQTLESLPVGDRKY